MLSVVFSAPENEDRLDNWAYLVRNFPPDRLYAVGQRGSVPIKRAEYVADYKSVPGTGKMVLFYPVINEPWALRPTVSLPNFEHPDDATYIFTSDDGRISQDDLPPLDAIVSVPCEEEMFSYVAAAIALYDRSIRHG